MIYSRRWPWIVPLLSSSIRDSRRLTRRRRELPMTHRRLRRSLSVAGPLIALLALASAARAIIIYDFPIFGIVNGTQTARINAVLQQPPDGDMPCPVALTFIDSAGNQLGGPDTFQLRDGTAVHADFIGDPGI